MKIKFAVITEIDPTGNKADDFLFLRHFTTGFGPEGDIIEQLYTDVDDPAEEDYKRMTRVRLSVFALGEILILNEYGREVSGHERKPSKWRVKYEEFDNVEDAIKRAQAIP
jgi:hypothetical protein